MTDPHPGRQCCVLDTVSLVKLCQLELGTQRAIEWILDDFSVHVPQKVHEECLNNLPDDAEVRKVYFEKVAERVDYEGNATYDHLLGRQVERLKPSQQSKIHEGEAQAAAFALKLCHRHVQYVVLVTDDRKATDPLVALLLEDQIGSVKNSYDLLLFLRSRHPEELPVGVIDVALRELSTSIRNNSPDADKFQEPEELLVPYLEKVSEGKLSVLPPGV